MWLQALLIALLSSLAIASPAAAEASTEKCLASASCRNQRQVRGMSMLQKRVEVSPLAERNLESSQSTIPIADVYPESVDKQHLYCYLKKHLYESARVQDVQLQEKLQTQSCAVVSSSGALLQHDQGHDINNHDVIMRFHSPTGGYEAHVGNRTDINLVGSHKGISLHKDGLVYPVVGETQSSTRFLQEIVKEVFATLYPQRDGMHSVPKDGLHDPTTGVKGMLAALSSCGSFDAYEMTPSQNANQSKYHYYDNPFEPRFGIVSADDNPWHGMIKAEHDLWRRLSLGPAEEIDAHGKTHYLGFMKVDCPQETIDPGVLGL